MVRKRGGSKPKGSGKKPRALNRGDSRIKKWDKITDIPMDEEDQFHSSRDKILLDINGDIDDDDDDEEVFALNGISDDDDDAAEDDEEDDMDVDQPKHTKTTKQKKGKGKAALMDSDSGPSSDEEEEGWGTSRAAYYSSNAAQLDSDDEEGIMLELKETKRLQIAARQRLTDDDFGFNDPIDLTGTADDDAFAASIPYVQSLPQDDVSLIRHFEKTDPESLALARDWSDTAYSLVKTQQHLQNAEETAPNSPRLGMMHLYYQTLLTYSGILAFYIHLRSSPKHAQHPEAIKSHPIISRLLILKQSLITMEDMDFGNSDSELEDDDESDFDLESNEEMLMEDAEQLWGHKPNNGLEDNELAELLSDATIEFEASNYIPKIKIKPLQAPAISGDLRPKKKRKTAPSSQPDVVFDLVEPKFKASRPSSTSKSPLDATDAYGEATELQHADAADKSARKKSLRFHTSKIENASARRRGARNDTVGGDDDIPYRERKRAKDLRLAEEAKKRLEKQGGADLDDVDPELLGFGDMDVDGHVGDGDADADGYYDLVKKAAKEKKAKRRADHEAATTRVDYEEEVTSGPRSISRAILKNKGLTPHRPKSVRNPRVKKRQKFEQAKKKISSQKAVYKGGDPGHYEGERSGISKVVKSVRLG